MGSTKQKPLNTSHKFLEQKKILRIIRDWAGRNKKVFWKYEVSCFYKTYTMKIVNLPQPSAEDIIVSSINRLVSNQQKNQLCDAIIKACINVEALDDSSVDIQIDYADGDVITEII